MDGTTPQGSPDDGRAELDRLHAEVADLKARLADVVAEVEQPARNRRQLLRWAAAGIAAAAVGETVVGAGTAAAAPTAMATDNTTNASAEIRYVGTTSLAHHVLWVQDGGRKFGYPESAFPRAAAVSGWSTGLWVNDGVQGVSEGGGYGGTFDGRGVVGEGVAASGILVKGQRATIVLEARSGTSINAIFDRVPGEMVYDGAGDLWLCVQAGNPGGWRKLAGPTAAGAFHPVDPTRVYDSRAPQPSPGPISAGQGRTITVRHGRGDSGAITVSDLVPPGATAVAYNLTLDQTAGAGFLTVNAGGDNERRSSSINWYASGQIVANSLIVKLDANRQITVLAGGDSGSTHFIVDVLGYYR